MTLVDLESVVAKWFALGSGARGPGFDSCLRQENISVP